MLLSSALLLLLHKNTIDMAKDLTVTELKAKMDAQEPVVLVDVREDYEHEEFNIGGTLIPVGTLAQRMGELEGHKEAEIVVYCRSGKRSGVAKQMLERAGFPQVRNLLGGMLDWEEQYGTEK